MSTEPLLEHGGVSLLVSGASSNLIFDGTEGTVKALGVLVGHELLNVIDKGGVGEAAQADVDVAVDDDGVAELGDDGVPVLLHEVPLERTTDNVGRDGGAENVHVS